MLRVPVLSKSGKPLMPTLPSRARRWLKKGKAKVVHFEFVQWREWHSDNAKHGSWKGSVQITPAPFAVVRRPPVSRRKLHLCVPSKGGKRRKYGGTVTRHNFRKGDKVVAEKAGKTYTGWCSGDTKTQISVSNANWKRIGQFTAKKVQLLQLSTGLIAVPSTGLSNLTTLSSKI
ncbi:RRXRR domain-containing protein [Coleofasciculus sp. E2-BRE-01]|uniref:RRXRR domain-containing protein n=1 Tax=Coleofasciculus sp. E2-BRE-01 TaxID=3069524 RepID=UPI0032FEFCBC